MSSQATSSTRALLVGAGAVGLVYGRHLALAGVDVSFYVRDKYREQAQAGYAMYPLNRSNPRRAPVRFGGFGVVTSADEVRDAGPFDQVWLCVSSPALRGGWLTDILAVAGDAAAVVMLTNGMGDRELLAAATSDDRIVQGMISMISYQGPLPGETLPEPGCAYWFPPLGPSPFSGPDARVKPLVAALNKGGCPAKRHRDVAAVVGFPTAILMPHLLALEAAGWKFDALRRGDWLDRAAAASREAMASVQARTGHRPPLSARLFSPGLMRLVTRIAPGVLPLPIETYLAYHFTKVGDQTRMYVRDYRQICVDNGLPADALADLERRLPPPATQEPA